MPVRRPPQDWRQTRKAARATDNKKLGKFFKMKPNIHPEYRPVAFIDLSINKTFIIP